MLPGPEPVLAFERRLGDERVRAWFNTSAREASVAAEPGRVLEGHSLLGGTLVDGRVTLSPYGVLFAA